MDLSRCSCDKAGFCPVFRRDMDDKNHHWCRTSSKDKKINYYQQNVGNYKEDLKPNKVGIITINYHRCGGVKTWCESLISGIKSNVTGIGTIQIPDSSISELDVPYGNSQNFLEELCSKSELILTWGFSDVKKYNPKKVFTVHHGDETNIWNTQVINDLDIPPAKIIAVNQKVAEINNYLYIPNSPDKKRCSKKINKNSKVVLWAHRFTQEKRPELAIEIAKAMPDFKFLFCGNMTSEEHVQKIKSLNNSEYLGIKNNLIDVFEKSSVFLSTSTQESYGYSVAEAVYSGLPVVSTSTGIAKTIADINVDTDDVNEWCDAIRLCSGSTAKNKSYIENLKVNFVDSWKSALCL